MNLLEILTKGGYMMIPIGIASLFGIAIIIERFIYYRRTRTPEYVIERCKARLKDGDVKSAIAICSRTETPITRVISSGLNAQNEKEKVMETVARKELLGFGRYLTGLATVAGVSPLLGFLGTVTGMIRAFMQVERLGGSVNASVLAGGIWEALITTAVGLGVGIITYIFYNYFVGRVQSIKEGIETTADEIAGMMV
jgi:biopolymer transport protein ExbB